MMTITENKLMVRGLNKAYQNQITKEKKKENMLSFSGQIQTVIR